MLEEGGNSVTVAAHIVHDESQPSVRAESLRLAVGLSQEDLPADLQRVTNHLGLKVYYANFKDDRISGVLMTDADHVPEDIEPGKNGTIFLKASEYKPRVRFTLAHEIGHFVLGHAEHTIVTDFYRGISDGYSDSRERDANDFAAELLMPKIMFMQLWRSRISVEELGVIFAVSTAAITTRARALSLGNFFY